MYPLYKHWRLILASEKNLDTSSDEANDNDGNTHEICHESYGPYLLRSRAICHRFSGRRQHERNHPKPRQSIDTPRKQLVPVFPTGLSQ